MRRTGLVLSLLGFLFLSVAACSDDKKSQNADDEFVSDTDTDSDSDGDSDSDTDTDTDSDSDSDSDSDDTQGKDSDTGSEVTPITCADKNCEDGQYCDEESIECVAATCDMLECEAPEECQLVVHGAVCAIPVCESDEDCPIERYCGDDNICVDDVCIGGEQSCAEDAVMVCAANGSALEVQVSCTPGECLEGGMGQAGCGCEDNWDCTGYQFCEQGMCIGPINELTCTLDPMPLDEVLPAIEIMWGGIDESTSLTLAAGLRALDGEAVPDESFVDSPWSPFGQVVQTPLVANLNDDNGDGRIDNSDVPEIIFITFENASHCTADGVLRAISGGGRDAEGISRKGRDLLAVCGEARYYDGVYYSAAGDPVDEAPACASSAPTLDSTATLAVGDLDYDGIPEIVAIGEDEDATSGSDFNKRRGSVHIYSNTGQLIARTPQIDFGYDNGGEFANPGPSLANVIASDSDEDELAEIVVGRDLFVLGKTDDGLTFATHQYGMDNSGANSQGPVSCVADLIPDRPGMEIVAGGSVYGIPLLDGKHDADAEELVLLASANHDGFCGIADLWGAEADNAPGPGNPLDGEPEIVLVVNGDMFVYRLEKTDTGETEYGMTLLAQQELPESESQGGGAPNIDDFDGDGFPEIGTASRAGYVLFDLQASDAESCPAWETVNDNPFTAPRLPPDQTCTTHEDCGDISKFACGPGDTLGSGRCMCFHNGWITQTQDDSSKVTGSSVFDFNGDGAAEVIYNDECHFRLYSGLDGTEHMVEPSESRTRIEYPVVADVDNDGNAEIVFATSNESKFCTDRGISCVEDADCPSGEDPNGQKCIGGMCTLPDRSVFNNGIEVWGDPQDTWVSARRIWNQHAYHVTNITESGKIPISETSNWLPADPSLYNTYRSQPRNYGIAPDLLVTEIGLSSPDAACGTLSTMLDISVAIKNAGDLRGGEGAKVIVAGKWDDGTAFLKDENGDILMYTFDSALFAGQVRMVTLSYTSANNDKDVLPGEITVLVDPPGNILDPEDDSQPHGVERECNEVNNEMTTDVSPGDPLADLRIEITSVDPMCPAPTVVGTVFNDGALDANDVEIALTAGDPALGGETLIRSTLDKVAAGGSTPFSIPIEGFPIGRTIQVYAVVDPANTISECNNGNNQDGPTDPLVCPVSVE